MNKSIKKSVALFAYIFVVMGMWTMLSVHCQAAETNNDENSHRPFVSAYLRIPLIMSKKMVSDEDMAMNLCRLCQAIPDGNLSM